MDVMERDPVLKIPVSLTFQSRVNTTTKRQFANNPTHYL